MKKPLLIIAVLTIFSCNNKPNYDNYLQKQKELNECKLEQTMLGYDSLTVCIICDEKVK